MEWSLIFGLSIAIYCSCYSIPANSANIMSTKRTAKIPIAPQSIGSHAEIICHTYGPDERDIESCYIQAALHADELPGLLVAHHLTRLLDKADGLGLIKKKIVLVPYGKVLK